MRRSPSTGSAQRRQIPDPGGGDRAFDVDAALEGPQGHVTHGLPAGRHDTATGVDPGLIERPGQRHFAPAHLVGHCFAVRAAEPGHVDDERVGGHYVWS